MTLAQRQAQVGRQLGGLTPVMAAKRDKALAAHPTPPVHTKPGIARPSLPRHVAAGVVSPNVVPPDPDQVVGASLVYPGEITLDVDTHIPAGTTAAGLQEFAVLVYDSTGTLVYSQEIPANVDPTTYNGQPSGGYCYGWWPPSQYPADWCFWSLGNAPGGPLKDGQVYFAQVLFESTSGDFSPNGTYSNNVTVFYTPNIPGAEAGICTCYAQNSKADPVNTATGAYYQQATDLKLTGAGTPFALTRNYRSDRTATGLLGTGWSTQFDASLAAGSGTETLSDSDGSQIVFTQNPDGTYSPPAGVHLSLVKTASGFTVSALDHTSRTFDANGRLTGILDASGHGLAEAYDASGHLASVTDTAGRVVTFTVGSNGLLTKAALPDGRSVSYAYTGSDLSGVTDVRGGVTAYTYDGGNRLLTVVDALGHTVVTNTYDATTGRISSQTDGVGAKTTFAWKAATQESDMTDPNGGVWTDIYAGNVLTQSIDPFGNSVSYSYDKALNQIGITDRAGNTTSMTYDAAGNMLTRTAPAPLNYAESWTYDSAANITSHTDGNNHKTSYAYDSLGRLSSTTDPNGGVAGRTYTSLGEQATTTTPRGKTTSYGYDTAGNRTSVTTPAGEKTTFTFDSSGRVLTKTDPRGNLTGANAAAYTTTYTYNAADLMATAKDPAGNTTTYGYDADAQQSTVTDPLGHTATTAYDANGRVTGITDATGKTVTKTYDLNGNLLSATDPLGEKTTSTYDKANRKITSVSARGNASGASPAASTTTFGYDADNNQTTVTDPTGAVTTTVYDAINRPVTVTDPLGLVTTTAYDATAEVTSATDPPGHTATTTYDPLGHVLTSVDRDGHSTTSAYDADGNRVSQTTAAGETTKWTFDADERMATVIDPRGTVTGGNPAAYTTTYNYDAAGNLTTVTDPLGGVRSAVYDGANRQTSTTDPMGDVTAFSYDAGSRLTGVTAPDGGATGYGYDTVGDLTTRTDANTHVTTYAYDAAHRVTGVTDPLNHTVGYTYDADGHATVVTDARGQTTTRSYDGRGLLTNTAYSDGAPTVAQTFDKDGRLTGITDSTGSRTLAYDNAGQLAGVTGTSPEAGFSYTYDNAGNVLSRTYPDGEKTAYTYNNDNEQATQTADAATTTYGYDAAGHLTSAALPSTVGYTETRTFDAVGRLTAAQTSTGTATLASWNLTLDKDGRPTSVAVARSGAAASTLTYGYDAAGRLTSACTTASTTTGCPAGSSVTSYTYDKVGNRQTKVAGGTTTRYTYDAADELTSSVAGTTTTSYTYDADGDQTAAGSDTFTYNAAGQLSGGTIGGYAKTFTYDAAGNRVKTNFGTSTNRVEVWDSNNAAPQLATMTASGGALTGDYHYDPLGTIASEHTAASAFYDTHDYLGSVTDLLSGTGVDQVAYTYDAFGSQSAKGLVTTPPTQPFGFTGGLNDQSISGKVDLRARVVDVATGRFTSRDPHSPATGDPYVSSYAYAADGPTYLTDPSGKDIFDWLGHQWDQFSSGFVIGVKAPFKLVGDVYDAATGQNGGWGNFFDTYVPVRPAYRLYHIADLLRQQGCPQLADLYSAAGDQLAGQIAALGIGGLTGWERDAAAADSGAVTAGASKASWTPIDEQPGGAIGQADEHACTNACGEMLNELLKQDETIRDFNTSATKDEWYYTGAGGLASELNNLDPGAGWIGGSVDIMGHLPAGDFVKFVTRNGPAAVMVNAGGTLHSVVVDGVAADGTIMIRDPWAGGSTYRVSDDDFRNFYAGQVTFRN
jgi:RHS repeat-associated protein